MTVTAFQQANQLLREGKLEAAVVAYRSAISQNPDFYLAYHNLGEALEKLGHWEESVEAYGQALELKPEVAWSLLGLSRVLPQVGQIEEAQQAWEKAAKIEPKLVGLAGNWQGIGNQPVAENKIEDAIALYKKEIILNPDYLLAYHKAIAIQPRNYELYFELGNALLRQNQIYGAITFYKLAQILQPNEPKISLQLEESLKKSQLEAKTVQVNSNSAGNNPQSKTTLPQLPVRRSYDFNSSSDDVYAQWLRENSPKPADFRRMAEIAKVLKYQPLISVVMPVYNTDEVFLREAILSVIDQVYPHWELCIADDASPKPHVKEVLKEYAAIDQRIKVVFRSDNGHISACSNSALELATGEFVALLDHDDVMTADALYEVVLLLNTYPEADMIYSDEDKLNQQRERTQAYFKPDWCPESFLSQMYTCHLGVYRRSIIDEIGGFRKEYAGCQDYDLVLRFTEKTNKIFHIPKILYHWRIHPVSAASGTEAKPYVYELIQKLLLETIHRRGENGRIVQVSNYPGNYIIRYDIQKYKLVSIIIPTKNLGGVLNTCLKSIFEKSTYPNYEVIVIDNGSDEPESLSVFDFWKQQEPKRFKCYELDIPFNYSRLNNYATTKARGDYLLLLNNDTEVITPDWIEGMVEQVQREKIGAVGTLLLYPDGLIQHAGVVLGIGDVAGHSHHGFLPTHPGYFGRIMNVNNYSAVTGACLMCRREVFEEMGGLDEELVVAYNDVDLCLKMLQKGYRNVYLPHVMLYHHESKSRGYEDSPEKQRRSRSEAKIMHARWGDLIQHDPCYNPNLTREKRDYTLQIQNNVLVEILSVYREPESDLLFACAIDSPVVGKRFYDNVVMIKGWILGRKSKAVTVRAMLYGEILQQSPVHGYRADVAKVYPQVTDEYSGFYLSVKVSPIPTTTQLQLQTVLQDGSCIPIGSVEYQVQLLS